MLSFSNSEYHKFLRRQPCVACGVPGPSEVAHFRDGTEGIGKKAGDLSVLPLCAHCHRTGRKAYNSGSEKAFVDRWGLNPINLMLLYVEAFKGR